jgi:carboxymethylenebutenolidase
MCDDFTRADDDRLLGPETPITRRRFAAGAGMAGAAAFIPEALAAAASQLVERDVLIKTADGMADCFFVHPAKGRHAAVLIWPDIWGLRPAMREMAKRLAASGYAVLVVNPFYRAVKSPVLTEAENRTDEGFKKVREQAMKLSPATNVTDARAFVAFLDAQKAVNRKRKVGTIGYCMGGPMVMRTAATLPGRIGAGASFHGGGLATDKPESPHLLIPQMKASFLIAVAENDDQRNPQEKETLRKAFEAAKLPAEIEVYAGANHGWCPPDSRVYNQAQAEKAWARLLALFSKSLA